MKIILLLALIPASVHLLGSDCPTPLPTAVRKEISKADGWSVLSADMLPDDDAAIWREAHKGLCPGSLAGRFTDREAISYVVALVKRNPDSTYLERVLVFPAGSDETLPTMLIPSTRVISPFVLWKVPPGRYRGTSGVSVLIRRESFVYEKIESIATQYYWTGGRFHSFQTAE